MAQKFVKMPETLYKSVLSTISALDTDESKELYNLLTGCNVVVPKEKVNLPLIFSFIPKGKIEKDYGYQNMHGIYHDPEHKVAVGTDGHKMMVSPADYDEANAGKTIMTDGSVLDPKYGRFPKWVKVLPKETEPFEFPKDFEMDYMKSLDIYKAENKVSKRNSDRFDWISIGIEARTYQHGVEILNFVGMSLEHSKMILSLGLDGWEIQKGSNMLVKRLADGSTCLIMPKYRNADTDCTPTAVA